MKNRSEEALVALRRILRATEFNARNLARASGLTPSQLMVLQFLDLSGDATPSEIARHASLTQATVTSLIDHLERRKFVSRRRDKDDRRRTLVKLLRAGRKALDASPDALQMQFEDRFAKLPNWEQGAIVAMLERVAALLDAEEIDAAPVLDVGAINEPPQKAE